MGCIVVSLKKLDQFIRGQGTIEYLVLIAVVIIIAFIAVFLLFGLGNTDKTTNNSNKISSAIGEYSVSFAESLVTSSGKYLLTLQNTDSRGITVDQVIVGDIPVNYYQNNSLNGGESRTFMISSSDVCTTGGKAVKDVNFTFTKNGVQRTVTKTVSFECVSQINESSANLASTVPLPDCYADNSAACSSGHADYDYCRVRIPCVSTDLDDTSSTVDDGDDDDTDDTDVDDSNYLPNPYLLSGVDSSSNSKIVSNGSNIFVVSYSGAGYVSVNTFNVSDKTFSGVKSSGNALYFDSTPVTSGSTFNVGTLSGTIINAVANPNGGIGLLVNLPVSGTVNFSGGQSSTISGGRNIINISGSSNGSLYAVNNVVSLSSGSMLFSDSLMTSGSYLVYPISFSNNTSGFSTYNKYFSGSSFQNYSQSYTYPGSSGIAFYRVSTTTSGLAYSSSGAYNSGNSISVASNYSNGPFVFYNSSGAYSGRLVYSNSTSGLISNNLSGVVIKSPSSGVAYLTATAAGYSTISGANGSLVGAYSGGEAFLAKFSGGNFVWSKKIDGVNYLIAPFAVDASGNIYIVPYVSGSSATVNGTTIATGNSYLRMLNSSGEDMNLMTISGRVYDVIVSTDGENVYFIQ